jgi:hypothetical protein
LNRPILGPPLKFREPLLDVVELAHLADLPHLIDRDLPVREYETVPPERGEDGSLPIYTLTPGRIRERTTEEVAELREQRERERAERYRWVYGLLGLRVVASRDGTLELGWRAGSEVLGPGEPRPASVELPPPTTRARRCPCRATPTGRGRRACVLRSTKRSESNSPVAFRIWAGAYDPELRFGAVKTYDPNPSLSNTRNLSS